MAEDKNPLDLWSLATGGTQEIEEQLQDEQLNEVNGGGNDNQELEKRLDRIEKKLRQMNRACF